MLLPSFVSLIYHDNEGIYYLAVAVVCEKPHMAAAITLAMISLFIFHLFLFFVK